MFDEFSLPKFAAMILAAFLGCKAAPKPGDFLIPVPTTSERLQVDPILTVAPGKAKQVEGTAPFCAAALGFWIQHDTVCLDIGYKEYLCSY